MGDVALPVARSVGTDLAELLRTTTGVLPTYLLLSRLKFV